MRVLKNASLAALGCFLGWLIAVPALADSFAVTVKQAELRAVGANHLLSADIEYPLSNKAIRALRNGIPLFWELRIKIFKPRKILWNITVAEKQLRFRMQYHALLNMYRIRNEENGLVYNFSTLPAALDQLSSIRNLPFFSGLELGPKQHYLAAIKIQFDRESLPLPLRPISYIDPQWYLSSDWYVWPLTK